MRVIAGELRGRKLLPPEGTVTRPITDRVKQALFDILRPHADEAVYDCFAGTGSLGIEALSRGAPWAVFFESDAGALRLLRQNLGALGLAERGRVVGGDALEVVARLPVPLPAQRPGIVFFDPPYRYLRERPGELAAMADRLSRHVAAEGLMVFRHDAKDELALAGWERIDVRQYGGMTLEMLAAGGRQGDRMPPP